MAVGARAGGYDRYSDDTGDEEEEKSAYRNSQAPPPADRPRYDWQEVGNADVLVPREAEFPLGVVHFLGGAGVGVFPRNSYGALLTALADNGFLIIATRVPLNEFNHQELACDVARDFRLAYREVESLYGRSAARRIPLFGLGHSLGAKVHVLLNSYPEVSDVAKRRKANVLVSFNNFKAKDSVPFLNELRSLGGSMGDFGPIGDNLSGIAKAVAGLPVMGGIATQGLSLAGEWAPKAAAAVGSALSDVPQEFKPSPEATWSLVEDQYSVRNNLVLQFKRDTIDQSPRLAETLFTRFGGDGELKYSRLDGTHVTPNTPDLRDTRLARDWANGAGLGPESSDFVEGGAKIAASAAITELDELIATVTNYLRSQSLWVRRDGLWDSDEM